MADSIKCSYCVNTKLCYYSNRKANSFKIKHKKEEIVMHEKLQATLEFLIFTVGVKMIIGHWIAERVTKAAKAWFGTTPRTQAIWQHYQLRAAGRGHAGDNVLTCGQEDCKIFAV